MGKHPYRTVISIKLPIFAEHLFEEHLCVTVSEKCNLQDTFFEEHFWVTTSEKCNFSNFLKKVQLTLKIQINVKLIKLF